MKSRAFRITAAVLCIFLLAGTPVLAGPVVVSQVVQVLSVNQNPVSLRLQNSHQTSNAASGVRGSRIDGTQQGSDSSVGTSDTPDTLLSGISVLQGQNVGVDIVDQDDVEGTICDCGEILVAGARFTAWPFFLLAAVPLVFIPRDNDNPKTPETPKTPRPTPTPNVPTSTPTPQPVPEPATLLLLGTGLAGIGASLRKRRAKGQIESQLKNKKG
jgi:hypothetical protein